MPASSNWARKRAIAPKSSPRPRLVLTELHGQAARLRVETLLSGEADSNDTYP